MPTYDYVCTSCGHELEIFQSMKDDPLRKCPKCRRLKLSRRIGGGAGLIFKGSGFYETDYRSKSKSESKDSDSSGDSGKEKSSDSKKSDSTSSDSKKSDSGSSDTKKPAEKS